MSDFDEISQLEAWGRHQPIHDHMHYEEGRLVDNPFPEPVPDAAGLDPYNPNPSFSPLDIAAGNRTIFFSRVQQQIEGGEYYPRDPIAQEDYMLGGLDDLVEREVITEEEHMAIFASWIMKRRPDTAVLKVAPKPRGYGRGYHNE